VDILRIKSSLFPFGFRFGFGAELKGYDYHKI
jgi:hypothetical protein